MTELGLLPFETFARESNAVSRFGSKRRGNMNQIPFVLDHSSPVFYPKFENEVREAV